MFTTLSTILVPISTGFTSSLPLAGSFFLEGIEIRLPDALPLETLPLEGEHDCCLRLPVEAASAEDGTAVAPAGLLLEVEADLSPGLLLVAEAGLSGNDVLKFGGASREKPGISLGFQGLDLTVGELPRDATGFFDVVGTDLVTEEDRPRGAAALGALEVVGGWRVGVAGLDADLEAGNEGLAVGVEERAVALVGVEERAVALVGVEDLAVAGAAAGLLEGNVAREVGVEDLEDFADTGKVGLPVGVAGLEADFCPPEEEGLLMPIVDAFNPDGTVIRLVTELVFEPGSSRIFVSCNANSE